MEVDFMREILFRGKTKIKHGQGEEKWVYGGIVHQTDYYGDVVDRWFIIDGTETHDYDIGPEYEVVSETVGQYTGLTDKNGKQIFEGDILSIAMKLDYLGTHYYHPPIQYPANVLVRFSLCAWVWEVIGKEKYYIHFPEAWCHFESEVIGNIYDNPELLEGED